MTPSWKPAGHTSVAPYLLAREPQGVIDFLVATVGAVPERSYERPDGSILHAEVRIDDAVVMIGGVGADGPTAPSHVHVYVPDVDRVYAAALSNGAESVQEPVQRDDPDRRCGVLGPAGHTWWFSTRVGAGA